MKKLIALIMSVSLCCWACSAFSQEDPEEELTSEQIIDRYIQLSAQLSQNINENDISQTGRFNMALTTQYYQDNNVNNAVYIDQYGNSNTAISIQQGNNNLINMSQRGDGNYVKVDIEGDNNASGIFQIGYSNLIEQEIIGDDYNYLIRQLGNNNEIKMDESSIPSKSIEIEQKGNYMKLEISTRKIF